VFDLFFLYFLVCFFVFFLVFFFFGVGRELWLEQEMEENHESQYSPTVACIYVFNLVVGTGILALPSVLITGGWFLGGLFLLLVCFFRYNFQYFLEQLFSVIANLDQQPLVVC
jgi:Na+/H+ antiporter NhaC